MFDKQDIIDNLALATSKQWLCRLNRAFIPNASDYVQVQLDIISEEAEYVKQIDLDENIFDFNSKGTTCYVKDKFFKDIMTEEEWNRYDSKYGDFSLEKDIDIITKYLDDKLIVINPYFYYNSNKDIFFKNGQVSRIIEVTSEVDSPYLTIPVIPNLETFKKMINKEPFAMANNQESIMGRPEYLYYDDRIFKVSISSLPQNDNYWKLDEGEDSLIELDYKDNIEKCEDLIHDTIGNFIFISTKVILSSSKLVEEEVKENEVREEEESSVEYTLSDVATTLNSFLNFTKKKNLCYSKNDIYNFYTCTKSSQLIILAGMSGTGKTKLPLRYAEYFNMNEEDGTLLFVPVSPSFTEPSDVLGFFNPNCDKYVPSETRLVEFLKHAQDNSSKMHMIIFDEMNLSQIEFWFAPFISILEKDLKDRYLYLYSETQNCVNKKEYPYKIHLGRNLILVGTINLDETTKNISDRLIDRSYIINLKKESFTNYLAQQSSIVEDDDVKFKGDYLKDLMPDYDIDEVNYIKNFNLRQLDFFDKVHAELNKVDPEKGVSFRSVRNISIFLMNKPTELSDKLAFDYAFKQTIMRKINGSAEGLNELLGFIDKDGNPHGILSYIFDEFSDVSEFKECRAEIKNKIGEIRKYGYTR